MNIVRELIFQPVDDIHDGQCSIAYRFVADNIWCACVNKIWDEVEGNMGLSISHWRDSVYINRNWFNHVERRNETI